MPTAGAARPGRSHSGRRRDAPQALAGAEGDIGFPVVAIGASAGGLDAFRILLRALPSNSGMAYILVQHLDPTHPSMLVELLAPHAAMPLVVAAEGARLEPDQAYVIPPGRYLTVRDGALRLASPSGGPAVRMPFDLLLTSLAEQCGERAIGIILSGTGSDGAIGA